MAFGQRARQRRGSFSRQGDSPYDVLTMSKATSKFPVSIPKGLAERIGIRVGDELAREDAAETLRAGRYRGKTTNDAARALATV